MFRSENYIQVAEFQIHVTSSVLGCMNWQQHQSEILSTMRVCSSKTQSPSLRIEHCPWCCKTLDIYATVLCLPHSPLISNSSHCQPTQENNQCMFGDQHKVKTHVRVYTLLKKFYARPSSEHKIIHRITTHGYTYIFHVFHKR